MYDGHVCRGERTLKTAVAKSQKPAQRRAAQVKNARCWPTR